MIVSQFYRDTKQGLLEAAEIEHRKKLDIADYAKDGRLTESSDGEVFDYRKMYEAVIILGRPLTKKEAEKYRIK